MSLTSTAFLHIPTYREFQANPRMEIMPQSGEIISFEWPASCNEDSVNLCRQIPFAMDDLPANRCHHKPNNFTQFQIAHISSEQRTGMTFCHAKTEVLKEGNSTWCDLQVPELACRLDSGNHDEVFWIYLALRMLFDVVMSSAFPLLDGIALKQAPQFGQQYSDIMVFLQIGSTFGTLVSGFLVTNNTKGKLNQDFVQYKNV